MKFLKKTEALKYFQKCTTNGPTSLRLFQEDVNRAGNKFFHVITPNDLFHRIKLNEVSHYYEFWSEKCKLLFSLDVDMKLQKGKEFDYKSHIVKIINNVISGGKKYYNHEYKPYDVVVLQNDEMIQKMENPDKVSFHIIFKGLNFENHTVCKDFFTRLNKDYDMMYCDKAIYNMTCFRLCFNSKMGKNAILLPVVYTIGKDKTANLEECKTELEMKQFWLSTLITNTDKHRTIPALKVKNSNSNSNVESNNSVDNINIDTILFGLPSNYYEDYDLWTKIGMILANISNASNDYYELWNRWSQQSDKYKEANMLTKWKSFKNGTTKNNIGIGTLIKWCREEGVDNIYKNVKQTPDVIVSNYVEREIVISKHYMDKAKILDQEKLVPEIFDPVLESGLLAIQSEKGTGKTSNLLESLFKHKNLINNNTSMLFISSRRTFGIKLLNDLGQYGFKLYSDITDPYITAKRVICQIDSLTRLDRDKYDYVIVDECESLARYLTSTHFTRNSKAAIIVSTLEMRIDDAEHVYIMDADLSDRCINYYTKIRNQNHKNEMTNIIVNKFKPYSTYTIEYMAFAEWLNIIFKDIDAGKKLVIPMASNSKAKDLVTKISRDFPEKKILLIHKETSDEEKLIKLLKVNEEWITYDVVVYTPSVCMGVSFDIPNYFDNIYAYGCSNSLGSQEFCQMLHRVRTPKNNKIYLAIDLYKKISPDDSVDYNTVQQMLCSDYYLTSFDLHNNILPKKITKIVRNSDLDFGLNDGIENDLSSDDEEKKEMPKVISQKERVMIYPYKEEPIYDLYVRNSWESIEDKLNFPAKLFGYVKYKGYQLAYYHENEHSKEIANDMKAIREERVEEDKATTAVGIFEAPVLEKDEYYNKIKQRDEYIDEKDVHAIKKFNIIKCYNLDKQLVELNDPNKTIKDVLTMEFIEEYNDKTKMGWYRNLSTIMNSSVEGKDLKIYSQSTANKLEIMKDNAKYDSAITNCYVDFTMKNKYAFHYYAIEIIRQLGFDINNLKLEQTFSSMCFTMTDCIEWCQKHKLEIIYKYDLMQYTHKNLNDITEFKDQLKFINSIISFQYGLRIKKMNNSVDPANIKYCLTDNDIWKTIKIRPVQLFSKREDISKYKNQDNSSLDEGIFFDD